MNMFKKLFATTIIAFVAVCAADVLQAGTAAPGAIIVMPARKRVVHLAFQITRCKDVGLITYNTNPGLVSPLLHAWNGQEWIQISLDDYLQGAFMSGDTRHVFLLGDNNTLPPQMAADPSWGKEIHRIAALDPATLINQIGKTLDFSSRQWKWLAEVNGLSIKDENAERRRYGRWGAPGKEKDLSPKNLDADVLPPAVPVMAEPAPVVAKPEAVIESKAGEAAPVTVKPVDPPKAEPIEKAVAPEAAKPAEAPKVEYRIEQKPAEPPAPPVVEKPAAPVAAPAPDAK